MRKSIILSLLLLVSALSFGLEDRHSLTYRIGSYNGKFLFPVSELAYRSPDLFEREISVNLRIRGMESLYLLNGSFIHIYSYGEWGFSRPTDWLSLHSGAGAVIWLDPVYNRYSSLQPCVGFRPRVDWNGLYLELPMLFRFYSDGFALENRLMIGYRLSEWFAAFLEWDATVLSSYAFDNGAYYPLFLFGISFSI